MEIKRILSMVVSLATLSLALAASAADPRTLSEEWAQGLLAGRDMAEFVAEHRAELQATAASRDRADDGALKRHAAALIRAERDARTLLRARNREQQSDAQLRALRSVTALLASHKLLTVRALKTRDRVVQAGLAERIVRRAEDALQRLSQQQEKLQDLVAALATLDDSQADSKQWRGEVRNLYRHLHRNRAAEPGDPWPILRADIAFGRRLLAPGPLPGDAGLAPSYADAHAGPGGAADLAGSAEAPLSPAVLAQAAALDYDYVRIVNFVRQTIRSEYYAGAMKDADTVLASGSGNDVDQASLLIALLRAASAPARYVHGVIEAPVAAIGAPLGLSDPQQVLTALTRAGIANEPVVRGGTIAAIRLQHTWVSAYVPYGNYRGAVVDFSAKSWIPLAPAFKAHALQAPAFDFGALAFDSDAFVGDYLNGTIVDTPLVALRNRVETHLAANPGLGSYAEQLTQVNNVAAGYTLLPSGLPFEVVSVQSEAPALAETSRQSAHFLIEGEGAEAVMDATVPVAALIGRRVTLSYAPASTDDYTAIREFGGMSLVPAYLVRLRPQLSVDGKPLVSGQGSLAMAARHDLTVTQSGPAGALSFSRSLLAGGYAAFNVGAQLDRPMTQNADAALLDDREFRAARLLYNLGAIYNAGWDQAEAELAGLLNVAVLRPFAAVTIVATEATIERVQDLPFSFDFDGVSLDAALRSAEPIARRGDAASEYAWLRLAGLHGSFLEADVFQRQWVVNSISADQGLRLLAQQGLPTVTLTPASPASELEALPVPAEVKNHISQWLGRGYRAMVGADLLSVDTWTGAVWHLWHPQQGSAGYFIAGTYAGGQTTENPSEWLLDELGDLANPYDQGSNQDPSAAFSLRIVPSSNGQLAGVNEELDGPLTALVFDILGRPVEGAQVNFSTLSGDGQLLAEGDIAVAEVTVTTDRHGVAQARLKLGSSTRENTLYTLLEPGDENTTRLGTVLVDAKVTGALGEITLSRPFFALIKPGDATAIVASSDLVVDGYPKTYGGFIRYRVEDAFGNPVSNVALTFTGQDPLHCGDAPSPGEGARFMPTGACEIEFLPGDDALRCTSNPLTLKSSAAPRILQVFQGSGQPGSTAADSMGELSHVYPIEVSSQGLTSYTTQSENILSNGFYQCDPTRPETRTVPWYVSILNISQAQLTSGNPDYGKVGETNVTPRQLGIFVARRLPGETFTYEIVAVDNPSGRLELDGTTQLDATQVGPYRFEAVLPLSNTAARQPVRHLMNFEFTEPEGTRETFVDADFSQYTVEPVYAIDASIELSDNFVLDLDENGLLASNLTVPYRIMPAQAPVDALVQITANDNPIFTRLVSSSDPRVGSVEFPKGAAFDLDQDYSVRIVVEGLSAHPLEFEPRPLKLTQGIVKSLAGINTPDLTLNTPLGGGRIINNRVPSSLAVMSEIDIPNQRVCERRDAVIDLSQDARITIALDRLDRLGLPTGDIRQIMTNEALAKGEHPVELRASELGTADYQLKINAIADADGSEEEILGKVSSRFILQNNLPVGHPIVKGVDLSDGGGVLSREDINIPGLGAGLKFVRTYASKSRLDLGVMGPGWTHNYLSRVIETPCGDYIVTGAEGGNMRFAPEGNGFRPLKGYHGTLIQDASGNFDFYPKGGTRYHFTQRQRKTWWLAFTEDPNGNRSTLTYEERPKVPVIKQVTDPSGRSLVFEYASSQFSEYSGEVLTKITGPAGIELNFSYDTFGNLMRVARENDSAVEGYEYFVDSPTFGDRSLLKSVRDDLSGSQREYRYEDLTLAGTILDLPTLSVTAKVVTAITEPDGGRTDFAYTAGSWGTFETAMVADGRGQDTAYTMNAYGASVRIDAPNGIRRMEWKTDTDVLLMSETDENGRVRSFDYDAFGNVSEERLSAAGAPALSRRYDYFSPEQFSPPYIKNRVRTYTNWRGLATGYTYDSAGNLLSEILEGVTVSFTYDSRGNRRSVTDGNLNTSVFDYDDNGYQTAQADALNNRMEMRWDARGRKVVEIDASGNTVEFDYDQRDRVTEKRYRAVDLGGGTVQTLREGIVYDDALRRRSETDRRGNTTVYDHDPMGRVVKITNALQHTFEYVYDPNGNKTLERDWLGRETRFDYDPANRLMTRSEPLGKVTAFEYDNVGNLLGERTISPSDAPRETRFAYEPVRYFQTEIRRLSSEGDEVISRRYDGEGNITQETDPLGRITGMDYDAFNRLKVVSGPLQSGRLIDYDPAGNVLSETVLNLPTNAVRGNDYDPANRVKNQTDAEGGVSTFEYFPNGTVKAQIDPRGNRSEFSYNALNLVLRRSQPYQGGDAVWTFEYDENGNLTTENLPNGNRIEHDYDELNRESARRDSEGPIVAFGYDAAGNVKSETDGNGNVSTFNYNELNQRTDELRPLGRNRLFTYTVFGEVKTETDAIDNTLTHSIDDLGRRRGTTGPLGLNLAFSYDPVGNLKSSTDSRGVVANFVYNDLNQRTDETVTGLGETYTRSFGYDRVGNVTSETDRRGIVSLRFYDKENRLKRFERDGKVQERRDYDKAGNLLFLTDANGNTTGFEYEQRNLVKQENRPESLITQFTRDAMGDAVFEDRPGQRDIERAYDLRRRLKEETNGAGETTAFEYDANNNQTARVRPLGETHRWSFRYDEANRLDEVEDPLGNISRYDYDTRDNRTAQTDANNRTTGFDYDARNRLKQKTYPDLARVDYGYDVNGNLTALDLPHGVHVDYGYDALNRRTDSSFTQGTETIDVALTLDPNGNVTLAEETIAGTTHRTGLNFDRLDRLTRITDRHDQSLQYGYDANGNRKELIDHRNQRTDYRYDAINRLDQVIIPGLGTIDYDYHPDGRLKAVIFPNGSQSSYNYDQADRIDTIAHRQSGEEVAFYDYDHDANGNRARQDVRNGQGTEITTYQYDRADRLGDIFYPDRTVAYILDPVGNRTLETATPTPSSPFPGYVRNYDYNTRDQLTQVDDDQGLLITYQYDENGNQVQKTENGSTTTFGYSARDRLTTVTPQGQAPIQFSYDYRGLRQEKQANGNTTRYVYDEQSLLAETNTLGNTIARYHYGSDRRLAETRSTQNAYFMIDALGTPIAITTQEGTVQTRYTYDAWGNLDRQQGVSEQPFGFTGYVKDEETDLYYAQQRYYDSFTGRFLREDPFGGSTANPPSLHRYLYAFANPTIFIDPDGRTPLKVVTEGAGEVAESGVSVFSNAAGALFDDQTSIFAKPGLLVIALFGGATTVSAGAIGGVSGAADLGANTVLVGANRTAEFFGGDLGRVGQNAEADLSETFANAFPAVEATLENPGLAAQTAAGALVQPLTGAIQGDPRSQIDLLSIVANPGSLARTVGKKLGRQGAGTTAHIIGEKEGGPGIETRKVSDPPGTARNSAGQLVDERTRQFVRDPNVKPVRLRQDSVDARTNETKRDVIVSRDGAVVPNSPAATRQSLEDAGFVGKKVSNPSGTETGTIHNIPEMKMDVRVMDGGLVHPPRVVTARQGTNQPVNPSDGSNFGNVPKAEQRARSHIPFRKREVTDDAND